MRCVMPTISGTVICKQCQGKIDWEYVLPQHISSGPLYDVVKIDPNKSYAKLTNSTELCVRCKNCGSMNILPYSKT